MSKTPDYTKKAINTYRSKFDLVQIRLPKGTKEKIQATGAKSVNDYIVSCVIATLNNTGAPTQATETPVKSAETEKPKYLPLTPENVAKVDLVELTKNIVYQFDIRDKFGQDGLAALLEEAKKI